MLCLCWNCVCACVMVKKTAWEKRSPSGLALMTLWGPYRSLCCCCCGHNGRRIDFNCVIKQVVTTATTVVACISLDLNLFMETAKQSSTAGNAQFPNFIFTSANVLSFIIIIIIITVCWQLFSNDVTLHQIVIV